MRKVSRVQCPHGSHGGSTGLHVSGASYSLGGLPGLPEEWGGGCHTRPNPFSRHFLCKTRWAWKQLGESGKFSKGNKEKRRSEKAPCNPPGPPPCSEAGETGAQRNSNHLLRVVQITKLPVQFSLQALSASLSGTLLHGWVSEGGGRNSLCTPRICCLDGRLLSHVESNQRHARRGETRRGRALKQVRRWETGWNPGGRHGGGGNACTWPWGGGNEIDSVEQWGGWALLVAQWLEQRQRDRQCAAEVRCVLS